LTSHNFNNRKVYNPTLYLTFSVVSEDKNCTRACHNCDCVNTLCHFAFEPFSLLKDSSRESWMLRVILLMHMATRQCFYWTIWYKYEALGFNYIQWLFPFHWQVNWCGCFRIETFLIIFSILLTLSPLYVVFPFETKQMWYVHIVRMGRVNCHVYKHMHIQSHLIDFEKQTIW